MGQVAPIGLPALPGPAEQPLGQRRGFEQGLLVPGGFLNGLNGRHQLGGSGGQRPAPQRLQALAGLAVAALEPTPPLGPIRQQHPALGEQALRPGSGQQQGIIMLVQRLQAFGGGLGLGQRQGLLAPVGIGHGHARQGGGGLQVAGHRHQLGGCGSVGGRGQPRGNGQRLGRRLQGLHGPQAVAVVGRLGFAQLGRAAAGQGVGGFCGEWLRHQQQGGQRLARRVQGGHSSGQVGVVGAQALPVYLASGGGQVFGYGAGLGQRQPQQRGQGVAGFAQRQQSGQCLPAVRYLGLAVGLLGLGQQALGGGAVGGGGLL